MAQAAFDRMNFPILNFDDRIATHAKAFPCLKRMGWFLSGVPLVINPGGKFFAVDPDMVGFITAVWRAMVEPISQGGFRNVQVFSDFPRCVKHGQQTGGFDQDIPGNPAI
ncbi:hypothetical protein ADN01_15150 [Levilinea saccharolytica]|uniref:Uncharacterized protein n=1 Tax=Levilinea saccharolytica TaxID=229921 RepID=A0A0P6XSD3_9CHLR|nr:hypothetical protein ADN01_15150 [Levilinea saccharolytica]